MSMNGKTDYLAFFTGLPLAIVVCFIVLLIVWRVGKKRRWFDERSKIVNEKAMSISWIATTIGILVVWLTIVFVEGPGLAFWLMTSLWVIHIISFGIGSIIANRKN